MTHVLIWKIWDKTTFSSVQTNPPVQSKIEYSPSSDSDFKNFDDHIPELNTGLTKSQTAKGILLCYQTAHAKHLIKRVYLNLSVVLRVHSTRTFEYSHRALLNAIQLSEHVRNMKISDLGFYELD